MTRSKIYKELTTDEINKIMMDLYGNECQIKEYHILKGGLFNTTYKVTSNNSPNTIVVRVGPVNKHLLFDFEKDMMTAEQHLHRLLHDHSIPTSNVIKYSAEKTVLDREYIITEFIDSIPMNDPSLANVDLSAVYEELGRYTNKLHHIKNNKFGWLRQTEWGLFDKWSDFIIRFSNEAAEKAEENNLYEQADIDLFRQITKSNLSLFDEISIPYMAHTDLWQGNVLLSKIEDTYKVSGIIDLDRTIFGDQYWDFSTPWVINESFLKGYGGNIHTDDGYLKRQDIYKLIGGFFGAYVCLIEYDDYEWFCREKENIVNLLKKMREC